MMEQWTAIEPEVVYPVDEFWPMPYDRVVPEIPDGSGESVADTAAFRLPPVDGVRGR